MKDWILILLFAIFGIIGYLVMGLVDRSIGRHAPDSDKPDREKEENEHAETGKSGSAHPGLTVFFHIQR